MVTVTRARSSTCRATSTSPRSHHRRVRRSRGTRGSDRGAPSSVPGHALREGIVVAPDAPSALGALVSLRLLGHHHLPRSARRSPTPIPGVAARAYAGTSCSTTANAFTTMRREGAQRMDLGGTRRTKCFRCSGVTEASRAPPSSADQRARAGPPHARQEAPPRGATGGSVRRRARLEKRPWQAGAAPSAMADGCRARGGLEHLLMMSTTTRRRADRSRSGTAAQHRRAPAGASSA